MSSLREHKHQETWFKNNLIAIPGGIVGNCSACIFRNTPMYCAKMSCTYLDNDADFIESVYWRGAKTYASISMWPELVDWFNTTPSRKIMEISNDVMKKSVREKLQNAR